MNRKPLSPVTTEQIDTYGRDGVVHLKSVFDSEWISLLLGSWERMRQQVRTNPSALYRLPPEFLEQDARLRREIELIRSEDIDHRNVYAEQAAGFLRCKYMRWWSDEFRSFVFDSPAGQVIGEVIGAQRVRFFLDAMFMKEPAVPTKTYWHADHPAWPTQGEQVPTMWMPLLPVRQNLSCLEFVAGSQTDTRMPWPNTFNAKHDPQPADRPSFYDWEQRRTDPGVRFLSYDMEPGDALVIHPRTYHGGGANLHPTQPRIALSTRWFGDDVRWDPREGSINTPGMPLDRMRLGEAPADDRVFPVVWERAAAATGAPARMQ